VIRPGAFVLLDARVALRGGIQRGAQRPHVAVGRRGLEPLGKRFRVLKVSYAERRTLWAMMAVGHDGLCLQSVSNIG
jgi:hypothetical protein